MGGTGRRNDLTSIKRILDDNDEENPIKRIANEYFSDFVRYNRGFDRYLAVNQPERHHSTEVIVFYGEPGTGKSYRARHLVDDDKQYWKMGGNHWWDGYRQQELVVFDEFKGGIPWGQFLQIMDENPLKVEVKGACIEFTSKMVAFTSNAWPKDWYKPEYPWEAFKRRVNHWIYCHSIEKEVDCGEDYDMFIAQHLIDTNKCSF